MDHFHSYYRNNRRNEFGSKSINYNIIINGSIYHFRFGRSKKPGRQTDPETFPPWAANLFYIHMALYNCFGFYKCYFRQTFLREYVYTGFCNNICLCPNFYNWLFFLYLVGNTISKKATKYFQITRDHRVFSS